MTHKTYKKIAIILAVGAVLAVGGYYAAALNGFFGGGGTIPEDTMTRGLVGYWSMDEGSGQTAFDASGNSNNGRLGSSSTADVSDPKWSKGKNGGGMSFDGKDDYVDILTPSILKPTTQYLTIEAWIKPQNLTGSHFAVTEAWCTDFRIGTNGSKAEAFIWTSDDAENVQSNTSLSTNNWYHIVMTYDNLTLKLYLNGKFENSGIEDGPVGNIETYIYIGSNKAGCGNAYPFSGSIDDVRIYNRALSAEEVRYHYNRGGPVAEWKFDEGSGTAVYDSSGNEFDGVLHE